MKLIHKTDAFSTHQPVLIEVIKNLPSRSKILELGSGRGSTELIHKLALKYGHLVTTVDDSEEWIDKYRNAFVEEHHSYILCSIADINTDKRIIESDWDLVFIDQGDWNSRFESLKIFANRVKYIMIHDSDYFPKSGTFGKLITPAIPDVSPQIVEYSDVFKSWKEYYPNAPWAAESGPPTLLGSNLINIDLDVDFSIDEIDL